ncbi:MAG: hypothetical protein MR748_09420 [Clostridiales bacterium]|nr:hypothetical protein [Clostridiales bacterium]
MGMVLRMGMASCVGNFAGDVSFCHGHDTAGEKRLSIADAVNERKKRYIIGRNSFEKAKKARKITLEQHFEICQEERF